MRGQTDDRDAVQKPRPTWVQPATITKATRAEIDDVHQRLLRGEITPVEACHFIDTHYFDEDQDDDEEDWDEEDDDDWEEDELFQTDIPPPKRREWG